MRAQEKNEKDTNRTNAMYSIIKGHHQADPDVVERFERSPYWPVLNFDKGSLSMMVLAVGKKINGKAVILLNIGGKYGLY